jgi:uncharacterized hydrophobic protein (TIGR00341 family)
MALRLIEIYLPEGTRPLPGLTEEYEVIDRRDIVLDNGDHLYRFLIDTKNTDALLEWLREEMGGIESFRIVIISVAATLPHPSSDEEDDQEVEDDERDTDSAPAEQEEDEEDEDEEDEKSKGHVSRISREEVLQEVNDSIGGFKIHHVMVILSTIVAAGGMMRDSPAVVIGAMVIAPLIGPNIALSLGTTLADWKLIRRSATINFSGLAVAFALSIFMGVLLPIDATSSEIASRTEINIGDVALALAAGIAGVLSVTRGVSTSLIGVMVAVALLPPLVVAGLMVGMGMGAAAYGAGMLTIANIVALNLSGVLTFVAQGIRPVNWYEEKKAKKSRFIALGLWLFILAILILAIVLAPPPAL